MKKFMSLFICIAILLSLNACGNTNKTSRIKPSSSNAPNPTLSITPSGSDITTPQKTETAEKTIYVILKILGNQYWSVVQAGAEQAGKDLGCKVVVVGTAAESEVDGQIRFLQDAVAAKADGIVIGPLDKTALAEPIKNQFDAGTPMILIDSNVDGDAYSAALMTDNVQAGTTSAEEMLRRLKDSGLSETEDALIGIQVGSTGSMAINDRLKGFYEYWDANAPAAWQILKDDVKVNDGDIAKATTFCQDFIDTYPNLKAVFGPNNGSTVGFVNGLTDAERKDIIMIGFDFSAEMEEMIRSNDYMVSSVVQRQYFMGYDGVKLALDIANGGSTPQKNIDTGVMLVTPENVDSAEVQEVINPGK